MKSGGLTKIGASEFVEKVPGSCDHRTYTLLPVCRIGLRAREYGVPGG